MNFIAIINREAGSISGDGERLAAALRTAFISAGHVADVEIVDPKAIENAITAAISRKPDAIFIGGGDGTLRTAARNLTGSQIGLGILPLGTFNRLASELRLPRDPIAALHGIDRPREIWIDTARINGEPFLCNSIIGLPVRFSQQRARLRGLPILEQVRGFYSVVRDMIRSRRRMEIVIDDGRAAFKRRIMSIVVSNNLYDETAPLTLKRREFDAGRLGLYMSKHHSGLGMVLQFARVVLGRWDEDVAFERLTSKRIVIRTRSRELSMSNDGEVETLATPLLYEVLPRSLKLILPDQ